MIKIRELRALDLFRAMTFLGDDICTDNEIDSIGILDYEAVEGQYNLFRKGDLVLTTLMFAKNDASLIDEALIRLMKQRVSAIAIKKIYYDSVSAKVQDYADRHQVQLMMFDDISFEDIIITISDEIRRKDNIKYCESRIDRLMEEQLSSREIQNIVSEINSSFKSQSLCMYCVPKKRCQIDQVMKNVRSRNKKGEDSIYNSVFTYRDGIFIIHTANSENIKKSSDDLLKKLTIREDEFNIYTSKEHKLITEIIYGIREVVSTASYCQLKGVNSCEFGQLGLDKLLMPLRDNHWVKEYSDNMVSILKKHDLESNYHVLPTAIEFVKNNGELKKTADAMYQHVNTIRYRINKIKELLVMEDKDDFYEQLYIALRIYDISENR